MLRADDIHARIGSGWPAVLAQLGIPDDRLRKKAGPCPACGGEDRFTFDNRKGRGDYFCRGCGAGSGFDLLMRTHRWSFAEARREVLRVAGIEFNESLARVPLSRLVVTETEVAVPSQRVRTLRHELCDIADCEPVRQYLENRGVWPVFATKNLRAHSSVEYWHEGQRVGRFPALVGVVTDLADDLATLHVTYVDGGQKLATHEPRKLLSPLTGRRACAVRLAPPAGEVLGIAEGIETALAAARLHEVPTWAALNASLLARFEPPRLVERLMIFADRDVAGWEAAAKLMERLQGRVTVELRAPPAPAKDWNDVLRNRPAMSAGALAI